MDMISIPDFSFGAMENWGLVTYRDVYLLYDPSETSSASKMAICSIIAHELAHMWYGNLVTIKWWDDIWLNEGFAQFMQYKATAAVEPSWDYQEHFVIKDLNRVFEADSSLSTHPILTEVKDENAIQAVFDPVTYAKVGHGQTESDWVHLFFGFRVLQSFGCWRALWARKSFEAR